MIDIRSKFIEIDGVKTHYLEGKKNGNPTLFLHGWPVSSMMWDQVLPHLKESIHPLAIDLPGFGFSDAFEKKHTLENYVEFLTNFIQKICAQQVNLVGYSFGSILSVLYASQFPDGVNKLILGAPPVYHKHYLPKGLKKSIEFIKKYPDLFKYFDTWGSSRINRAIYAFSHPNVKESVSRDKMLQYIEYFKHFNTDAFLETMELLANLDIRDKLKGIKAETLIIVGDQDKRTKVYNVQYLNKHIPNSEMVIINGADHGLPVEKPKEFAEAILSFIEEEKVSTV
jgi:pimeloyl-ACP methyl ester carboxylesterase